LLTLYPHDCPIGYRRASSRAGSRGMTAGLTLGLSRGGGTRSAV
jgi:hypothetical protein